MQQTGEVLLVIIFQIGVVILGGQVLGQFVIATGKGEFVAFLAAARHGQAGAVTGSTAGGVFQLSGSEGQVVDFIAGDLATLEGLREQAAIVGNQDRQLRLQSAVTQFGLGNTHLRGCTETRPLVRRLVTIVWEHRAANMTTRAAVELQA